MQKQEKRKQLKTKNKALNQIISNNKTKQLIKDKNKKQKIRTT